MAKIDFTMVYGGRADRQARIGFAETSPNDAFTAREVAWFNGFAIGYGLSAGHFLGEVS